MARSPQVIVDTANTRLHSGSSARDLLEHVVQEGALADRDAAAEALTLLPSEGQPSVEQVQGAQVALGGSPVVRAWKALDDSAPESEPDPTQAATEPLCGSRSTANSGVMCTIAEEPMVQAPPAGERLKKCE